MVSRILRCAGAASAVGWSALAAAGAPHHPKVPAPYAVTDLGTLPGCDNTLTTGVNDAGWVSGFAYAHVPPGHGDSEQSRPFLWRDGQIAELAKLGGHYGQALTINARGDVAGYAEDPAFTHRPVVWRYRDGFKAMPLSELPGEVRCLLADGAGCGYVYQDHASRAAMWERGKLRLLGAPGDLESVCYALNSSGVAVGEHVARGGQPQSPLRPGQWQATVWKDGRSKDLPSLSGRASICEATNERGVAAGWSDGPDGRRACLWTNGKVEALPVPDGFTAQAHAINEHGVVVGEATERAGGSGRRIACRWRDGKPEDLNGLIPARSGWTLSVATGVTRSGLIAGYGSYARFPNHHWRAFLLTPTKQ